MCTEPILSTRPRARSCGHVICRIPCRPHPGLWGATIFAPILGTAKSRPREVKRVCRRRHSGVWWGSGLNTGHLTQRLPHIPAHFSWFLNRLMTPQLCCSFGVLQWRWDFVAVFLVFINFLFLLRHPQGKTSCCYVPPMLSFESPVPTPLIVTSANHTECRTSAQGLRVGRSQGL